MPYIKEEYRPTIDQSTIEQANCVGPGELNYAFTKIIDKYIEHFGLSYHIINEIVGALECCKLEAYRRVAAPYEEAKTVMNGDVYTISMESK